MGAIDEARAQLVSAFAAWDWSPAFPAGDPYSSMILAEAGLLGYWRLGDKGGSTAGDSSPNAHPMALSGTYLEGEPGALPGDIAETSIRFTTGRAKAASNLALYRLTGAFTLELWVKWNAGPGAGVAYLLDKGDGATGNGSAYQLIVDGGAGYGLSIFKGGALTSAYVPNPVATGVWQHWVGTRDSSGNLAFYINGSLVASGNDGGGAINDVSSVLAIADSAGQTGGGDMWMEEVAIYNTNLSAARVLAHYNQGLSVVGLIKAPLIVQGWPYDIIDNILSETAGLMTQPIISVVSAPTTEIFRTLGDHVGPGVGGKQRFGRRISVTFSCVCWADEQMGAGDMVEKLAGQLQGCVMANTKSLAAYRALAAEALSEAYRDRHSLWRYDLAVHGFGIASYDL